MKNFVVILFIDWPHFCSDTTKSLSVNGLTWLAQVLEKGRFFTPLQCPPKVFLLSVFHYLSCSQKKKGKLKSNQMEELSSAKKKHRQYIS